MTLREVVLNLFSIPVSRDGASPHVVRALKTILLISLVLLCGLMMSWIIGGSMPLYEELIYLIVIVMIIIFIASVHYGYVHRSALGFLTMMWCALTLDAYLSAGIRDVAFIAHTVIIVAASILLTWRAVVAFTSASVAACWFLASMEAKGIIHSFSLNIYANARDLSVVIIILAVAAYLLARSLQAALRTAEEEVEVRKRIEREIRELNETLEERVANRTRVLQERTEALEMANAELESITYSMSHDMRAPLRAINGYSHILIEENGKNLSEDAMKHLLLVRDRAREMGELIDGLLTFFQLSRHPINPNAVSTTSMVKRSVEELIRKSGRADVEIVIGDLPDCDADAGMIAQVWKNLLDNALKFTGGQSGSRISIGGHSEGKEHIYFVEDNGVGFDMAYKDKLFGIFQKLHGFREYPGGGIGLATAQRIVHRHGGRLWAEGQVGKGSIFYFSLPIN